MKEKTYHALLEGMDSFTSHIVRTVLVLSRDREITDREFLGQVGMTAEEGEESRSRNGRGIESRE